MDEPDATYQEGRFGLHRRFELFPDRVRVVGRGTNVGRFDETIPLGILQPEPSRVWVRGLLFGYGKLVLLSAACAGVTLVATRGLDRAGTEWTYSVLAVVAATGLLLVAVGMRQVEFARFRTDAGVFALDVGRVGPDAAFDEFTELLVARIRQARAG